MHPQAMPLRLEPSSDAGAASADRLCLTYEQRTRSRLLVRLDSGAEAAVVLPRGTHLRDGDRLQADDGRVVVVAAAPEPLLEVRIDDASRLARAAYHLGNRHVAVQICDGALRIADDAVLERMLANLGLAPYRIAAPFEPEGGAYGHSHAHAANGSRLAPIIHEYRRS
jgi:urease accessory protein